MKFNKFLGMGAAAALVTVGVGAHQAYAVQDALTAKAYIVTPLTLDCSTQDLDFGNIEAPTAGGASVVNIDTSGTRTVASGSAALVGGGTPGEGQCTLAGDTTFGYTITVTDDVVSGPGPDMAVDNFDITDGATNGPSPYSAALVGGAAVISIGADLTIAQNQTAGAYTGTVTVDAVYQ